MNPNSDNEVEAALARYEAEQNSAKLTELGSEYTEPNLKRTRRNGSNGKVQKETIDRLPPHSLESEQGVLGCVMLSPNECLGECIQKFSTPEVFYDLRHREIYISLIRMYDSREAIDVITLQQQLKDRQMLDQVGGIAYLSSIPDAVPSASNLSFYTDIVQEKYILRRMIQVCTETVAKIYEFEGDVPGLLDEVERDILRIGQSQVKSSITPIKELVKESIHRIEDAQQRGGVITGIPTGFTDLDRMTNGLQKGEVFVIAARPSMGKTSLGLNIAEHVTCDVKLPVGVFSMEMTADSLTDRLIASRARVNLRNIRDGFLAERDFPKLSSAAGRIANSTIYIDDTSSLSILQLRAKARRYCQQYGIKLFVIDYLQLMNGSGGGRRLENRQQEIADISSGIKSLSKELGVPIILLSQLNRELDKEKNRKPRLSDLRESGAIEQDADIVGLLYKPKADREEDRDACPVNLLIAKQRNGPTGDVNLTFLKSFTRFESAARVTDDDFNEPAQPQQSYMPDP